MRVTPPVNITAVKVIANSAVEPSAFPAYSAGTTYDYGAIVSVAADFRTYESLAVNNTGNTPSTSPLWWRAIGYTEAPYNAGTTYALGATVSANNHVYQSRVANNIGQPLPVLPSKATTSWVDLGPTNRMAAFDLSRNTQTVWTSPLTLTVAPGERVNTLGLLGLVANTAVISATSVTGGGLVYGPNVIDLNTRQVADGYEYAFEPFSTQPSLAFFDLPPFTDIIITVTLSSTSGNVKCGSFITGTYIYLGAIQYGAENSALNFSVIKRDDFGETELVPRRTVPKNRHTLKAPKLRANKIRAARVLLNAVPALWTGLDDGTTDLFDTFTTLGIYTLFNLDATNFDEVTISLEVEEI